MVDVDPLDHEATCWVIKDERVEVEFAGTAGVLESAVGANAYQPGDALLTGATGDRWSVSRDRFDTKYRAEPPTVAGHAGLYRNLPVRLRARRMDHAFTVHRSPGGDLLRGEAGDWLIRYAPRDFGIVAAARFAQVYRRID